jgi:hypothetical protein
MWHKTFRLSTLLTVAAALLCAGLLPRSVNAQSTIVVNQRQPFDTVFSDECTGEDIQVVAEDHVLVIRKVAKDGTVYWEESINTHGTATGLTTGRVYVYNETIRFTRPAQPGPECGIGVDFSTRLRLVSKGAYPDLFVQYSFDLDISPSCEATFDETFASACRP